MENPQIIGCVLHLSRNLRGIPFPQHLNDVQKAQLTEELCENICRAEAFSVLRLGSLTQPQLYSLAEQQIIDSEHAKSPLGKAVLCSDGGNLFININCDNHLEMVGFDPNAQPKEVYARLRALDETLEKLFPYAFDDEFGFLSPSPAGIGTGLEASILLHLPVLKENRVILRTIDHLSQLGFLLRGLCGTGNEAKGAFYQLTNRLTLGLSEEEAIDNLSAIAFQLARQEAFAEDGIRENEASAERTRAAVELLRTTHTLSLDEGIRLLSDLRLGGTLGLCPEITAPVLNSLLDRIQPATLLNANLQCLSMQELDRIRAELMRGVLRQVHFS